MSKATVTKGPLRVSVHFPEDVLAAVNETHDKLKDKNIARNLIITKAIRAGLPAVLKQLKDREPEVPFSKSVEDVVASFTKKQDITTKIVCERMREQGFDADKSDLMYKVSQCLVRLKQRETIKRHKLNGRKSVYRKA